MEKKRKYKQIGAYITSFDFKKKREFFLPHKIVIVKAIKIGQSKYHVKSLPEEYASNKIILYAS